MPCGEMWGDTAGRRRAWHQTLSPERAALARLATLPKRERCQVGLHKAEASSGTTPPPGTGPDILSGMEYIAPGPVRVDLVPGYGLRTDGDGPGIPMRLPAPQVHDRLLAFAEGAGLSPPRETFVCGAAGAWSLQIGGSQMQLACLDGGACGPVLLHVRVTRRTRWAGIPKLSVTYAGVDLFAEALDDIAWLLHGIGETVEDQATGIRLPAPGITLTNDAPREQRGLPPGARCTSVEMVDPDISTLARASRRRPVP